MCKRNAYRPREHQASAHFAFVINNFQLICLQGTWFRCTACAWQLLCVLFFSSLWRVCGAFFCMFVYLIRSHTHTRYCNVVGWNSLCYYSNARINHWWWRRHLIGSLYCMAYLPLNPDFKSCDTWIYTTTEKKEQRWVGEENDNGIINDNTQTQTHKLTLTMTKMKIAKKRRNILATAEIDVHLMMSR